jgi:hypothetical protein
LRLADDGWLEVKPFDDPLRIEANIQHKLRDYAEGFRSSEPSEARMEYLRRTLHLLTEFGRAVLVRLPIDPRLEALEHDYMPDFGERMRTLEQTSGATYLDMTDLNSSVVTNDGNHLRVDSARSVSRELERRILARGLVAAP